MYNKYGEENMKIYIGCDHRGVDYQNKIKEYLEKKGYEVIIPLNNHTDIDDYPDFAFEVCRNVSNNSGSFGILLCGTGIGMSIAANKVKGIRAARCVTKNDAEITRADNDANVLCLGINDSKIEDLYEIIDAFITHDAPSDDRHYRRIGKITKYETGNYYEL